MRRPRRGTVKTAKYPECEKLRKVAAQSQACGEFLEWLRRQGMVLAKYHEHEGSRAERNGCWQKDGGRHCGYSDGDLELVHESVESLLARNFGVDLKKVEQERRAMLAELRSDVRR